MAVVLAPVRPQASRRISLTPLIDIVFILLLFFILETNFLVIGQVGVQLPEPEAGASTASRETLDVQVFGAGNLWIDDQAVTQAELGDYLANRKTEADAVVFLRPEATVPLQDVVTVTDALRDSGLRNIQLLALEN